MPNPIRIEVFWHDGDEMYSAPRPAGLAVELHDPGAPDGDVSIFRRVPQEARQALMHVLRPGSEVTRLGVVESSAPESSAGDAPG